MPQYVVLDSVGFYVFTHSDVSWPSAHPHEHAHSCWGSHHHHLRAPGTPKSQHNAQLLRAPAPWAGYRGRRAVRAHVSDKAVTFGRSGVRKQSGADREA